jgi:hypothetical protein
MQACSWVASTTTPPNLRRYPSVAGPLPDDLRSEVVLVLAAMTLNQQYSAPLHFYKNDATLVEATGKHGRPTYRPPARHTRSPHP